MVSQPADSQPDIRRYVAIFVAQLALTGAAIGASRLGLGTASTVVLVAAVAAVNAVVVALGFMGVRRDGWVVPLVVVVTVFFLIGLLFWPAWDLYERSGRVL